MDLFTFLLFYHLEVHEFVLRLVIIAAENVDRRMIVQGIPSFRAIHIADHHIWRGK